MDETSIWKFIKLIIDAINVYAYLRRCNYKISVMSNDAIYSRLSKLRCSREKGKNFDPIEIILMISLCYKYFSFKIYMLTEYMFQFTPEYTVRPHKIGII